MLANQPGTYLSKRARIVTSVLVIALLTAMIALALEDLIPPILAAFGLAALVAIELFLWTRLLRRIKTGKTESR